MELNSTDLYILEAFRLERFRQLYAEELCGAILVMNLEHCLIVHCEEAGSIDQLLIDPANLAYQAGLITGAERIALYWLKDEVWSRQTGFFRSEASDLELKLSLLPEIEDMATATLEKPATASQPKPSTPQLSRLPIETVAQNIANITGQAQETIINNILKSRPQMSFENGYYLIPTDAGDSAIDQWANDLKAQLRQSPTPTGGNGKVGTKVAAKTTPTGKTKTTKPATRRTVRKAIAN